MPRQCHVWSLRLQDSVVLILILPFLGVLEIDPCFAWSQQVIAGVGVAPDIHALYKDMHTYLKGEHTTNALE